MEVVDSTRQPVRGAATTQAERPSLTTHIRKFGQDWGPPSANQSIITPFSAVSSFNLPAQYDASLITPVSTTRSPLVLGKHNRGPFKDFKDREVKLSPTISSPDYLAYSGDEDFKSPMKMKTPTSNAPPAKPSNDFPNSPLVCRSPYWGAFGVSAPVAGSASSNRSMSPGPTESPNTSAGAFSSDCRPSRNSTPLPAPASFRPTHPAPILIAPNPASLRGGSRSSVETRYRQDSVTSVASTPSSQITDPRSYEPEPMRQYQPLPQPPPLPLPQVAVAAAAAGMAPLQPLPPRRKRKSPPQHTDAEATTEISQEDQLLIQLSEKESLQWKEITQRFNELTGKNMKVPALQMRKKRLRERLRAWTEVEHQPQIHHIHA